MVLKQGGNVIGAATKKKNLFVLDIRSPSNKAMLVKGRGRPTYLLSKNPQIRLWHHRLGYASNARVIEALKLTDGIDITIEDDQQRSEGCFPSDSEKDNKDNSLEPSLDSIDIVPTSTTTLLNKMTSTIDHDDSVEQLCNPCIESKHIKIVRHKRMTPTTRKLQEIHADLWGLHDPPSLSKRTYVGLLLDEFTRKSWVLVLRSKDEFFDVFKLWLPRAEACGEKLGYLQTDGRGEFIRAALKSFCEDRNITIGYVVPYMHKENGIAGRCWRTLAIMKDSLLIDSGLPVNFWAEAMDTTNYLRNRLPTRRNSVIVIPEEAWTNTR